MKRGVVWLALSLLIALAIAQTALASYKTIGTYDKSGGQNWTSEGINFRIIQREAERPDFLYLTMGNTTEGLGMGSCMEMGNYRACFNSSDLGPRFDPDIKRTPYIYKIIVSFNAAEATVDFSVEKTKLLVNEETRARITLSNVGDFDISGLLLELKDPSFEFGGITTPCVIEGRAVVWRGLLGKGNTEVCDITLRPIAKGKFALRPVANYSDGRKFTTSSGSSVSIDTSLSLVSIRFANKTAPLGTWVKGLVDINNSDAENNADVVGSVSAPSTDVRGTTTFTQWVRPSQSTSVPFEMHLLRIGNTSAFLNATVRINGVVSTIKDKADVRVLPPPVRLKVFGNLQLPAAGNAKIDVEIENLGDLPLHNVTLRIWPPANMLMPLTGPSIELRPERNEQIYSATVFVPLNNSAVFLPVNISFTTDFGESITLNSNVTLRTGSGATKVTGQPSSKPATTSKATNASKPTQSIPTKQTTTKAQSAAQQAATINTFLLIVVIAIVIGAAFWFLSQADIIRGPKKPENEFEE